MRNRLPAAVLAALLALQAPASALAQARVVVEVPVVAPAGAQAAGGALQLGPMPSAPAAGLTLEAAAVLPIPQGAPASLSAGLPSAAVALAAVAAAPTVTQVPGLPAGPLARSGRPAGGVAAAKAPSSTRARARSAPRGRAAEPATPPRDSEELHRRLAAPETSDGALRELFHGERPETTLPLAGRSPAVPALDGAIGVAGLAGADWEGGAASPVPTLAPSVHGRSAPGAARAAVGAPAAETARARARAGLAKNSATLGLVEVAAAAGAAAVFAAVGLPWWAGVAAVAGSAALHRWRLGRVPAGELPPAARARLEEALAAGGRVAPQSAPIQAAVRAAAVAAGAPQPLVVLMPESFPESARTLGVHGRPESILLVRESIEASPTRDLILAHELQHARDLSKSRFALPDFALASAALAAAAAAANAVLAWMGLPHFDAQLLPTLAAVALGGPSLVLARLAHDYLLERRADLAAIEKTGDAQGLLDALGHNASLAARWRGLARDLRLRSGEADRAFPAAAAPAGPAPADTEPAFYKEVPAWAGRLAPDESAFATPEERRAYEERAAKVRPLARWMAHFYARLRERGVQAEPNLLTIQDLLNWVRFIRKFSGKRGWKLDARPEPMLKDDGKPAVDREGTPILMGSSLLKGLEAMFELTLPPAVPGPDPAAPIGRDLRFEVRAELQRLLPALEGLELPRDLDRERSEAPVPAGPRAAVVLDESPTLYESAEIEAQDGPDYIVTETVKHRRDDLLSLYDTHHERKFFPLLLGDTGEGKSSLVKHLFAMPAMRAKLGRAVPVVSLPMKEAMTRRELLGGKGKNGIEYGFLTVAAMNGWVLVLEELDQTTDEFRKALNEVLHEIRKEGKFRFEVAGQTVEVPVHPHFWVVGTGNGTDGNFAITRNRFTRDFMKRWVPRHFKAFPPAEEAEILRGLTVRWYGADFAERHGLTQQKFEKLVTDFHQVVRELTAAGALGGDLAEPYEFNRRTLQRFLKRFLYDLHHYESTGKIIDARTWHLLFAREVMEAYGAELRRDGERQAIWDHLNTQFELESAHGIRLEDVALEVRGLTRVEGRLVIDEKLVPLSIPLRVNGGSRVPGAGSRLTMIPTLARNVYRNLRNRQFREHQFSTGPTGAGKTEEEKLVAHLLDEPLFAMTLDEQTPMGELHGSWISDPASGGFRFVPGILARAMAYDPEGVLKGAQKPAAGEVRRDSRVGATLLINEGNASPVLETANPALDDGILNLSDGAHAAVAGAGFHVRVTLNPVGDGYGGYPLSPALKSRAQIVEKNGDWPEEELAEILVDQLTGVVRYRLAGRSPAAPGPEGPGESFRMPALAGANGVAGLR